MNPNVLEHLGLTPGESKVYLALLQLGPSSAGPIIEKSGLQNSVVHLCLNTLKDKGLISYVRKGRARIYQAADPENFLLLLE
ncbi:MAG: helix-turn-helix domain-containing protein [Candidatus Nanoarchaeia archaeon]